ncbi:zinc finger BED domain-containing protein 5-like [Watersipora subatra]|uniref:zinc finger BED domain-containing protein 5-like n=1 Tax=Watersipora subatra TaxID=2589382 RepID=UPI00355BE19B
MSKTKRRTYDDSYMHLNYGFACMIKSGIEVSQCVLCMKVLAKDSMKPHQLKLHLRNKHAEHINKSKTFFEAKKRELKWAKLYSTGSFHIQAQAITEASYALFYRIARDKKPHTIGETLVKPCLLECTKIILGDTVTQKIADLSLSDSTVKLRIDDMSADIKRQVIEKIKLSPMFAIQLDESTDVASIPQLMVFARYVHRETIEEEFLFRSPLTETTTAADVMNLVSDFFSKEHLDWGKLIRVCTDVAPAMLGCRAGFAQLVKENNPLVVSTHCFIHRQALAAKTLPKGLQEHLSSVIKVVNFLKGSALQTRLFHKLCEDMDAVHSSLLFHTEVRWLSKGNMILRFFNLRAEVNEFLKTHNKPKLLASMQVEGFHQCFAYLVDIFGSVNEVNTKIQGRDRNVSNVTDSINAFKDKLKLWVERLATLNVRVSFPVLHSLVDKKAHSASLLTDIKHHLNSLIAEFERYFPKLDSRTEQLMSLTRDPFRRNVHEIPEQLQEEFLKLTNNSALKDDFKELSIEHFWVPAQRLYPNISLAAIKMLIPFASTHLCEPAFSAMLTVKSKSRNRLEVEADLRCALSTTTPNIKILVSSKQTQKSH